MLLDLRRTACGFETDSDSGLGAQIVTDRGDNLVGNVIAC